METKPRRSTYVPQEIEPKWQKTWVERGVMKASDKSPKPKYYDLVMYPYPSGDMTVGHARNYVMGDVLARMKRMQGILYDWDREVTSCLPEYYKWTEWLFLLFYERGLAYRAMAPVNWCPVD